MTDIRLIESVFPLKQVSLDSVHEKNVRHGHVSTLHIWPARRPLAASRAALLATLLPDPGTTEDRREVLGRMAGKIVEVPSASGDRMKEETRGGILHWGRESEEDGAAEIGNLREEIRNAFGGRVPRVLDPFAGGGAIPLEAMRLGCEAVAADLNPVAWFILRCTLHYPHRLAGQARTLPEFALRDRGFAEGFLKARGITGKTALREELARLGHGDGEPVQVDSLRTDDDEAPASGADLAWHLRAWGQRVLDEVRQELAARYPTYAEFEPVRRKGRRRTAARPPTLRYRPRPARLLVPDEHGHVSTASLNAEFDSLYLEKRRQPALDCEAARGLALDAHRAVQRLPGRGPAPQDTLAVPEGEQARAVDAAPAEGRRSHRLRSRARSSGRPRKRRAEARARPHPRRRHHERERRNVHLLRRHCHDPGHSHRGPGRSDRRAHDGRRRGRAGGQGVSPADRGRGRSRTRDGGGARPALRRNSVRLARRAHQPGTAGAQLARRFGPAALRIRHVAAGLHEPPASRAGRVHSSHTPLRRRHGRLSRDMARGIAGVSRTVDQPPGRSLLRPRNLAKQCRQNRTRLRPLRTSHGLGLRGILPRGRYHRRLHPSRRVGGPRGRAHRGRRHGRTRAERDATLGHRAAARPLRPRVHRPALLRRHPLLRPHGLLPRLAAAHASRTVPGDRRGVLRAAGSEVGSRRERRRAGRSAEPVRRRWRGVQEGLRSRHAPHLRAVS